MFIFFSRKMRTQLRLILLSVIRAYLVKFFLLLFGQGSKQALLPIGCWNLKILLSTQRYLITDQSYASWDKKGTLQQHADCRSTFIIEQFAL
jgi:hypothetical protein